MVITHRDCETVYLSYEGAVAMLQAIADLESTGQVKYDSIYVSTPNKDLANWCDIMPTKAKDLLTLGQKIEQVLNSNN
jgi:hypothetical protein